MSSKFTAASVFVFISSEVEEIEKTVDIICSQNSSADICEIVLVFKNAENTEGLKVAGAVKEKYGNFNIISEFQKTGHIYDEIYSVFSRANGSHVIFLACDLETNPENIKDYISLSKQNPQMVYTASRWLPDSTVTGYSSTKRAAISVINFIFNVLYKEKLTDITFVYLIYPLEIYNSINFSFSHTFLWELIVKTVKCGYKVEEISTVWHRSAKKSSFSLKDLIERWITFIYIIIKNRILPLKYIKR